MQYTNLGRTDIAISRICLGCMGFGDPQAGQHSWTLDEDASRVIIKQALDAGINFFDTAMGYQAGSSERFVGRALRDFARREDVVVATKFIPRTSEQVEAGVMPMEHITSCLDASLERLGMDYVDLYIYHMWDWTMSVEQVMEALNAAVVAGKVRAIGFSNCRSWQLAQANCLADAHGWARVSSYQGHYNALFREDDRDMTLYCEQEGVSMTPYSALAGGRLARPVGETTKRFEQDSYAHFKYDATAEADAVIINRVANIARDRGVTMTEVALAWLLQHVTAPVAGATKPHHIDGAVAACDLVLTPEELALIDEPYVPHAYVGVMAENLPVKAGAEHSWTAGVAGKRFDENSLDK